MKNSRIFTEYNMLSLSFVIRNYVFLEQRLNPFKAITNH